MTANSLEQVRPTQPLRGHVDVLIVGAGISGLGMGHYLHTMQPGKSFAIVDSRDAIGGTWDLFRYPGIRSDSDLHTFGYEFKPWTSDNAIADAHEILDYLHEVVDEDDLGRRIHFHHKVLRANFDSATAQWTVTLERDGEQFEVTCDWLFGATGYYDYAGDTDRTSRAKRISRGASCIPSPGRKTSTTPVRRLSSSAVAQPR